MKIFNFKTLQMSSSNKNLQFNNQSQWNLTNVFQQQKLSALKKILPKMKMFSRNIIFQQNSKVQNSQIEQNFQTFLKVASSGLDYRHCTLISLTSIRLNGNIGYVKFSLSGFHNKHKMYIFKSSSNVADLPIENHSSVVSCCARHAD